MAVDGKRMSAVLRRGTHAIGPILFVGALWHFFGLEMAGIAVAVFLVFHLWGRIQKNHPVLRSPLVKGIGAAILLGLLRFVRWPEPLNIKMALWLVATTAAAIPVFVVWIPIEEQEPPHEGFRMAAAFIGYLLITLLSAAAFVAIEWVAGDL